MRIVNGDLLDGYKVSGSESKSCLRMEYIRRKHTHDINALLLKPFLTIHLHLCQYAMALALIGHVNMAKCHSVNQEILMSSVYKCLWARAISYSPFTLMTCRPRQLVT